MPEGHQLTQTDERYTVTPEAQLVHHGVPHSFCQAARGDAAMQWLAATGWPTVAALICRGMAAVANAPNTHGSQCSKPTPCGADQNHLGLLRWGRLGTALGVGALLAAASANTLGASGGRALCRRRTHLRWLAPRLE